MFAATYFAPRYFAPRYFAEKGAPPAGKGWYFAQRYFAPGYFALRYFPDGAIPIPPIPPVSPSVNPPVGGGGAPPWHSPGWARERMAEDARRDARKAEKKIKRAAPITIVDEDEDEEMDEIAALFG